MRKTIVSLLLLYLSVNLFAQPNPKIKWGNKFVADPGYEFLDFIGNDESGFYTSEREIEVKFPKKPKIKIGKYDNNHTLIFSKVLEIPKVEGEKLIFSGIEFFQEQLILFADVILKTKAGRKNQLFAFTVDKNTGEVQATPTKIGEIDAFNSAYGGYFYVQHSDDQSKLIVIGEEEFYSGGKKSNFKEFVAVFEKGLKPLWEKEIVFPHAKDDLKETFEKVSNEGDLAISVLTKNEKKKDAKQEAIIYYYKKGGLLTPIKIDIGNNEAVSVNFTFKTAFNNFSARVIYTDNKEKEVTGMYHVVFDESNKVISSNEMKFSKELKDRLVRTIDVNTVELSKRRVDNLQLLNYIPRKTGGGYVLAQIYEYISASTNIRGGDYFGKMLVINVDEQEELSWLTEINRDESLGAKSFSSIITCYNPETENLRLILNRLTGKTVLNSEAILITVNKKGEQTSELLFKNTQKENDEVIFAPTDFTRVSNYSTTITSYAQKKPVLTMGKTIRKFCTINLK